MAHTTPEGSVPPEQQRREIFDLDVSYVRWFSLGVIVLVIATAAAAYVMLNGFRVSRASTAPPAAAEGSAPHAVLQSAPQDELRAYRRSKATALEDYHWVDRSGGVVQIPIERAMELVAGEGVTPSVAPPVTHGVVPGDRPAVPSAPPPDRERTQ